MHFFIFVCAIGFILFIIRLYKHIKWQKLLQQDKTLKPIQYYKGIPVFCSSKIKNALLLGYKNPAIWISSPLVQSPSLPIILEHEATHYDYKDNYWLALIELVRNIYWWNPIVRFLCNDLSELLEARCDHQASLKFSTNQYQQELASLMLSTQVNTNLVFCGAVISKNPDVRRLQYLSEDPNMNIFAKIIFSLLTLVAVGLLTIPVTSFSNQAESNQENISEAKTFSINFQKIPMSVLTQILMQFYSVEKTIVAPSLQTVIFNNFRVKDISLEGLSKLTNVNWQIKDGTLLVNRKNGDVITKVLSDLEYKKIMNQVGVLLDFDIKHVTSVEGLGEGIDEPAEHTWRKKMAVWSNFDTPFTVAINDTREIVFTVKDDNDRALISSGIYQLNSDGTKNLIATPKVFTFYGNKAVIKLGNDGRQQKDIWTIALTPSKVTNSEAIKQRQ
ncbi:MAG: M56 family metallopeptidase [Enterobacterales bacterium]|nr:M56 family metallopeptidase [Enterobacterales bacterium]